MKIRPAKLKDLKEYLSILLEAFPKQKRKAHEILFKERVNKKEGIILEEKDEIIGFATFSNYISPPFKHSLYVEEFVIKKSFINKRYGSFLLKNLIQEAKRLKKKRIMLDTTNKRKNKAIKFYTKNSFKKVGKIKTTFGNKIFMEREIK